MFHDDQQRAYVDRLIRSLVRPEYYDTTGPEQGPEAAAAGPSEEQMQRGREAYAALETEEILVEIAAKMKGWRALRESEDTRHDLLDRVRNEVIRGHAERGYDSLVAISVDVTGKRAKDGTRRAARHGGTLDDEVVSRTAVVPMWGAQRPLSVEEEALDRVEAAEERSAVDLLAGGLAARLQEFWALSKHSDHLTDDQMAQELSRTNPRKNARPLDSGDVQSMRDDAGVEIRAMWLLRTGAALGDDTAGKLAGQVARVLAGDWDLDDIDAKRRGRPKRLARHLQSLGM